MGIDLNRFKGAKRNEEWLDWLEDDPVPASIRNRTRQDSGRPTINEPSRQTSDRHVPAKASNKINASDSPQQSNKTVSINISLPSGAKFKSKFSPVKIYFKRLFSRKLVLWGSVIIVGAVCIAGAVLFAAGHRRTATEPTEVLSENTSKPDFAYSLPKGDEGQADKKVRYDEKRKLVNFVDSIGGVSITVSQQPLPGGFADNAEDKVRKLAADFSATQVLATANPTAYLGTSAEGPQTVIFSKKGLLVFMYSASKIDDHDWAEYITNLQ